MNYPGYKVRNELQTGLYTLGDLIMQDVSEAVDSKTFLEKCYLNSGALSQYALVSKQILESRYSDTFRETVGGPNLKPASTKSRIDPDITKPSIVNKPIILLGDVGVGKTMFIKNFIDVVAHELTKDNYNFYINFGNKPTLPTELGSYITEELIAQLDDLYGVNIFENKFVRGVYHSDLEKFKKGIFEYLYKAGDPKYKDKEAEELSTKIGDKQKHIEHSLNHIYKARKKNIVIILDNIDQRTQEFQEEVFLIGHSMAETWPVTVFMSLRPQTFYKSKLTGTLSAYHPQAFTVSPPRIDKVLLKRLEFAIFLLKVGKIPSIENATFDLKTLKDYLGILLYSFQENDQLNEFVDNVCGGNVRLALDFVRMFLGSGHVNTREMLEIYETEGNYTVALHHFLRAIIYGDYMYYDSNTSPIINIFDVSTNNGNEHFIVLLILSLTDRLSQTTGDQNYVKIDSIFKNCQDYGFNIEQINFAFNKLVSSKLVETNTKNLEMDNETHSIRLTSVGSYYYKRMVNNFAYVDAMITDTPILDSKFRNKIIDTDSIKGRIDRCKNFIDYLDSQWVLMQKENLPFDWNVSKLELIAHISKIELALAKKSSEM